MRLDGANLIGAMWVAWAIYWYVAARNAKADARREHYALRLAHILPLVVAALLLWIPVFPGVLGKRFLPATPAVFWVGAALVAIGLGLAIRARRVLGRNWSGIVTVKEDHELVREGPYRWVRHPIYTGLLAAFAGSAIARGEWRGLVAVALVFAAFWFKLRREERWMIETFGAAYLRYRAEVRALIPFVL
ncbi:MAG TPA: isoprenylcysteine carboxylmethyltransferase family protein [Rhodanobacteraceae bacterium]|jgi:protein-S-isoprenylcysteine O-methyltransferase Ste14|nr:isoprenylcysteine carboxylmethyltransferase family protein [Rhodanobacteraceae bacterium]